jgi:hypothetical protein
LMLAPPKTRKVLTPQVLGGLLLLPLLGPDWCSGSHRAQPVLQPQVLRVPQELGERCRPTERNSASTYLQSRVPR